MLTFVFFSKLLVPVLLIKGGLTYMIPNNDIQPPFKTAGLCQRWSRPSLGMLPAISSPS